MSIGTQNIKVDVKAVLLEPEEEGNNADSQWWTMISGHWAVGTVIDSKGMNGLKAGDAVLLRKAYAADEYWEAYAGNLIKLSSGTIDRKALIKGMLSVCHTVLKHARPQEGDYILLNSDSIFGIFMLAVAKESGLRCIYSDKDKKRNGLAEPIADVLLGQEASIQDLQTVTDKEGPNIILDMTKESGRLAAMVQQISQAGRIVVCGNKSNQDCYHMRSLSIKEGEIIGVHVGNVECLDEIPELSEYLRYLPPIEELPIYPRA